MMNLFNLLADASENTGSSGITMWIIIAVMLVAFIGMSFMNNKNRKKQQAEEQKKRDNLCVRTKIITIGGIVGEVVSVDDNEFVLNSEGTTIRFDKRAIYQMTLPEDVQERLRQEAIAEQAAKDAAKASKGKKNVNKEVESVDVKESELPAEEVKNEKSE